MASIWSETIGSCISRGGRRVIDVAFSNEARVAPTDGPSLSWASAAQKGALLDEIAATTGYARRYAMWLLNHAEEGQHPPGPRRQRRYGPEVQDALFLAWHAANRICSKRLMPFLPTLIEALERHGHLLYDFLYDFPSSSPQESASSSKQ
jgi:hypothetical protein